MFDAEAQSKLRAKGGAVDGFWIVVTYVFVFGTLAVVAFATLRMFGNGHRHLR